MSDNERDTLTRLGEQLRPADDSFDRLLTRRDRRRRSRRLTAAAVALSLTAAGVFGAFQLGRRTQEGAPGDQPLLPTVARLECGPSGASVRTPEVAPQADGVHLDVTNTGEAAVMFQVTMPESGGFVERAEPGANTFTATVDPGAYEVRCFPESSLDPSVEPSAPLQITDQDGVWKDPTVTCPGGRPAQNVVYDPLPGATGQEGTPEEIARRELGGSVHEGDVVEIGGYPEAANPVVRVVRDGQVVAAVYLARVIEGGILVQHLTSCDEGPTGFEEPPTG